MELFGLNYDSFIICTDNCSVIRKAFCNNQVTIEAETIGIENEVFVLVREDIELELQVEEIGLLESTWFGCAAHLLQLVVFDALKKGKTIAKLDNHSIIFASKLTIRLMQETAEFSLFDD